MPNKRSYAQISSAHDLPEACFIFSLKAANKAKQDSPSSIASAAATTETRSIFVATTAENEMQKIKLELLKRELQVSRELQFCLQSGEILAQLEFGVPLIRVALHDLQLDLMFKVPGVIIDGSTFQIWSVKQHNQAHEIMIHYVSAPEFDVSLPSDRVLKQLRVGIAHKYTPSLDSDSKADADADSASTPIASRTRCRLTAPRGM
jgi:hypothetical protein